MTETAREIVIAIVQKFYRESLGDVDLSLMIEKALIEYGNAKLEEAARMVESNDEVTSPNKRFLLKKTSTNINGCIYAFGIRALKENVKR